MQYPHKNIRLPAHNYLGQRRHFVTVCCEQRRRVFLSSKRAEWLIQAIRRESISHDFAVYAYSVMPDHFHMLALGKDSTSDLLEFVKALKQTTAYEFERLIGISLWQKKFYDRILRPKDSVAPVAAYIWMNPVRKRMCKDPKSYPHSGSFVVDWATINLPKEEWLPPWKKNPSPKAPA